MKLTENLCKQAQPKEKPWKLPDEKGLFLHVFPNGHKYWRFRYLFLGRDRLIGFGVYPDVSLAEARLAHKVARSLLKDGIDPGVERKKEKEEQLQKRRNSEALAREEQIKKMMQEETHEVPFEELKAVQWWYPVPNAFKNAYKIIKNKLTFHHEE